MTGVLLMVGVGLVVTMGVATRPRRQGAPRRYVIVHDDVRCSGSAGGGLRVGAGSPQAARGASSVEFLTVVKLLRGSQLRGMLAVGRAVPRSAWRLLSWPARSFWVGGWW